MNFPLLLYKGAGNFCIGVGSDGKIVFARRTTSVKLKNWVIGKGRNLPEIPNALNARIIEWKDRKNAEKV